MLIQGNFIGFGMVVLSAMVALVGGFILRLPDPVTMIGVGLALIALDLTFRIFRGEEDSRYFGQRSGGYLFFAPVWLFGFVVIVINVVSVTVTKFAK